MGIIAMLSLIREAILNKDEVLVILTNGRSIQGRIIAADVYSMTMLKENDWEVVNIDEIERIENRGGRDPNRLSTDREPETV